MSVSIVINNLSKVFHNSTALQNINLDINAGELFGFIGPDGAGKTTLFRIITSLLLPSKGKISIDRFDVVKDYKQIRKITGYMPGQLSLYMDLTVEENLKFYAGIFKTSIKKNYELIKDIYKYLEPFKKRRTGDLSGGMKQKLALSCALIHKPKLLLLDEPTTGIDAVSRNEFWEMLKKMQQHGITIIVSTPYMSEATLCNRIALIQTGKLLSVTSPKKITETYPYQVLQIKTDNMYNLPFHLQEMKEAKAVYRFGEFVHFSISKHEENIRKKLFNKLLSKGHRTIQIEHIQPNIEDCFLELMIKPQTL